MYSARYAGEDASDEANLASCLQRSRTCRSRSEARAIAASSCIVADADDPAPLVGEGIGKARLSTGRAATAVSVMTLRSFRGRNAHGRGDAGRRKKRAESSRPGLARISARNSRARSDEYAAAGLVRPLSLVRAEMPVLRFQLAHAARRTARAALHRYPAARSRCASAGGRRRGRSSVFSWAAARPACFLPPPSGASSNTRARSLVSRRDIEITLEANPGTIERGRFADTAPPVLPGFRWVRRASMRGS